MCVAAIKDYYYHHLHHYHHHVYVVILYTGWKMINLVLLVYICDLFILYIFWMPLFLFLFVFFCLRITFFFLPPTTTEEADRRCQLCSQQWTSMVRLKPSSLWLFSELCWRVALVTDIHDTWRLETCRVTRIRLSSRVWVSWGKRGMG